jgi:hypothetical protein
VLILPTCSLQIAFLPASLHSQATGAENHNDSFICQALRGRTGRGCETMLLTTTSLVVVVVVLATKRPSSASWRRCGSLGEEGERSRNFQIGTTPLFSSIERSSKEVLRMHRTLHSRTESWNAQNWVFKIQIGAKSDFCDFSQLPRSYIVLLSQQPGNFLSYPYPFLDPLPDPNLTCAL